MNFTTSQPDDSIDMPDVSCLSDETCYHEEVNTEESCYHNEMKTDEIEQSPSFDIKEFSSLSFLKDRKFYTDYPYEIINTLFLRETSRIPCHFRSTQIEYREEIIDFMKFLCNHNGFTKNTLHLGIGTEDISQLF